MPRDDYNDALWFVSDEAKVFWEQFKAVQLEVLRIAFNSIADMVNNDEIPPEQKALQIKALVSECDENIKSLSEELKKRPTQERIDTLRKLAFSLSIIGSAGNKLDLHLVEELNSNFNRMTHLRLLKRAYRRMGFVDSGTLDWIREG